MDLSVKVVDAKSKEEINLIRMDNEILVLVLQSRKFIFQELKYDVVEFIPGIHEASVLAVSKVPHIYK